MEAYTTEFLVRFSRAIADENYSPAVSRADREKMQNLRHTVLSIPCCTGLCRKWHRLRLSALRTCMRYTARRGKDRPCATD